MLPPRQAAAALCVLLLAACGYVGEPLPPALMIPVGIEDLGAAERGDAIVIECTLPDMTTEGIAMGRLGEVELRIGQPPNPWNKAEWLDTAKRVETPEPPVPGPLHVEVPASEWAGHEVIIGVRISSPRGRWSGWSNLVSLSVAEPLPVPQNMNAVAVTEGVRITWDFEDDRPGVRFRVFRRLEDSAAELQLGETPEREWVDVGTEYGETYIYQVMALESVGDDVAESELTPAVQITLEDRFPPPSPEGLTAIAGVNAIELAWEPSPEAGAVTYRLFRAAAGRDFEAIAGQLTAPVYSDMAVTSGSLYRYAVSAVDASGNESEPSVAVEQTAP